MTERGTEIQMIGHTNNREVLVAEYPKYFRLLEVDNRVKVYLMDY